MMQGAYTREIPARKAEPDMGLKKIPNVGALGHNAKFSAFP